MTVTLKIKNHGGPYTVNIKRMRLLGDKPEVMGFLKPGEEKEFTIWDDNCLVITEEPSEKI